MEVGAQEGERGSVRPGEERVLYSTHHGKSVKSSKQGVACSDLCISKSTLAWFGVWRVRRRWSYR